MLIEVLQFTEDRGEAGVPLKDYCILPEDMQKMHEVVSRLQSLGAYSLVIMSVEVKQCVIDYEHSFIKFPSTGYRAHITDLLFDGDTDYCTIIKKESVTFEDLLNE